MSVRSSREFQIADLRSGDWLLLADGAVAELREIDPRQGGELVLDPNPADVDPTPLADCLRLTQSSVAAGAVVRVVRQAPLPPPIKDR